MIKFGLQKAFLVSEVWSGVQTEISKVHPSRLGSRNKHLSLVSHVCSWQRALLILWCILVSERISDVGEEGEIRNISMCCACCVSTLPSFRHLILSIWKSFCLSIFFTFSLHQILFFAVLLPGEDYNIFSPGTKSKNCLFQFQGELEDVT